MVPIWYFIAAGLLEVAGGYFLGWLITEHRNYRRNRDR